MRNLSLFITFRLKKAAICKVAHGMIYPLFAIQIGKK